MIDTVLLILCIGIVCALALSALFMFAAIVSYALESRKPKTRTCPNCLTMIGGHLKTCPVCGKKLK